MSQQHEEHEDWKIILADESSKQIVLFNTESQEIQVKKDSNNVVAESFPQLTCSLCQRPLMTESSYFSFLKGHLKGQPSDNSNIPLILGGQDEFSLPKEIFDEGYYSRFFKEIKILGRGARGSVYQCQHILNNTNLGFYAVKKIPIGNNTKWLMRMLREAQLLANIRHQNVIEYKHCWVENDRPTPFGPVVPSLLMLMEFVDGPNLEDAITQGILDYEQLLSVFEGICLGIRHLHSSGIIHRDLKPSNILLKSNSFQMPTAIVTDFGESQKISEITADRTGNTGTIEFCAPEVVQGEPHSKASDIWSLGMILYFISFGRLPWQSMDYDFLKDLIGNFQTQGELEIPSNGPFWVRQILGQILKRDPSQRLTIDQILNSLKIYPVKDSLPYSPMKLDYPRQKIEAPYCLVITLASIILLYFVCYPCSINISLLLILLFIGYLKFGAKFHLATNILSFFLFAIWDKPCSERSI
jgi:serine/threonine protein kinase